jgi:hypothetical protein
MFENWGRKLAGFALLVWAVISGAITWLMLHQPTPPTLKEWGAFLGAVAGTAGVIIGLAGAKSVATDVANRRKTPGTSTPVKTENP